MEADEEGARDAAQIIAECLARLSENAPADAVLTRLRRIETHLPLSQPATRARFLRARAIAANRLGFPSEALGDLIEARNLLRAAPDAELSEILRAIALVQSWRGEARESALALLQAVAAGYSDAEQLGLILAEAGRLNMEIGRPLDAEYLLRSAGGLLTNSASERERQRAAVNLLQALVAAGKIDEAESDLDSLAQVLRGAPQRLHMLVALEDMRMAAAKGDVPRAKDALSRAEQQVEPNEDSFSHVEVAQAKGELALAEGDNERAERFAALAIKRYAASADDLAPREIVARLLQAQALERLGRDDDCDRTLAAALRRAIARRLTGYADQIRSRIAARGGSESAWFPGSTLLPPGGEATARFVRRRPLGSGGFGSVERAYDVELGLEVAVKTIVLDRIYDTRQRPRLLASAQNEVVAASLVQHPGVARVYGMVIEEGNALIIEELIEGDTLKKWMDGPRTLSASLEVVANIAFALSAIHAAGIIHRDLKPENIILRDGRLPVVVDFGLAILQGQHPRAAGTQNYMSPEQSRGKRLDARADIYSLGVIAQELLRPFSGTDAMSGTSARPGAPQALAPAIDAQTSRLLASLCARNRFWRPRSAAVVGGRLLRCIAK